MIAALVVGVSTTFSGGRLTRKFFLELHSHAQYQLVELELRAKLNEIRRGLGRMEAQDALLHHLLVEFNPPKRQGMLRAGSRRPDVGSRLRELHLPGPELGDVLNDLAHFFSNTLFSDVALVQGDAVFRRVV